VKRLLIIYLALLTVSVAVAQRFPPGALVSSKAPAAGGGGSNPPSSPIVNQNFEGSGYDNSESWSTLFGTPDPDYTGVVLLGSQSLRLIAGDFANVGVQYTLAVAQSDIYGFAYFQLQTNRSGALVRFENSSFATVFEIAVSGTALTVAAGGAASSGGATTLSTGTTYYMWWRYTKGTGSDAVGQVWLSTTTTKPGSTEVAVSNGTSTTDVKYFDLLFSAAGGNGAVVFDHVYLDDAAILSNP